MSGGKYLDVGGVRTYYEVHGNGPPVVLLHGGLCAIETFAEQTSALCERFQVWLPERRGHGRTPDTEAPYTYVQMLEDTLGFMDAVGIDRTDVVGFSDGANIGLLLAIHQPARVHRLVMISGNSDPGGILAPEDVPERGSLEDSFQGLVALYGELSPDGPDHFAVVFQKLQRLWADEPRIEAAELATVRAPTLVMAADADLISIDHTVELYRAIPDARLSIVADSGHDVIARKPGIVNAVLVDFLTLR